jgi:hypothetical protein
LIEPDLNRRGVKASFSKQIQGHISFWLNDYLRGQLLKKEHRHERDMPATTIHTPDSQGSRLQRFGLFADKLFHSFPEKYQATFFYIERWLKNLDGFAGLRAYLAAESLLTLIWASRAAAFSCVTFGNVRSHGQKNLSK